MNLQINTKKGLGLWQKLGILISYFGIGFLVAAIGSALIWQIATGFSGKDMTTELMQPKYRTVLIGIQIFTSLAAFLLPALVYAYLSYKQPITALGLNRSFSMVYLGIGVLILISSFSIVETLGILNKAIPIPATFRHFFDKMEASYNEQVTLFLDLKSIAGFVKSLFVIALLPAITEEFFFRGALQTLLKQFFTGKVWIAIFLTAAFFSAIHMSWYGFLPRLSLGLLLGYIFYYTGNILYTILLHFMNNAAILIYLYVQFKNTGSYNLEESASMPVWITIISFPLVIGFLFLLRKETNRKRNLSYVGDST